MMTWCEEELSIKQLTEQYLPKESLSFNLMTRDEGGRYLQILINGKLMTVTLGYNTEWEDLKRRIDKVMVMTNHEENACHICEDFESKINNSQITCPKCANMYCMYCYLDMFKKNRGLVICPYCRYTCGKVLSEKFITTFLCGLMKKMGLQC